MLERWSGIWYNGRENGHEKKSAPPARETVSPAPEKPAGSGAGPGKGANGVECYRVLLVDDEEEIRAGISRKIDWDSLGFTLAGEADNGEEALELAELVRPDVVLTDIKMPFMDGLELCRRLKRVLPAAKTVVFSGFDDFEYARKAVGMGVSEYIMKPINAQEMSGVLLRLKDQLDQQQAERRDMESLRRRYEESLPVLRELFYTRLLDGQVRSEQIGDRAARYEIQMPDGPWTVALFDVDSLEDAEQRDELLLLSVQGFLTKYTNLDCVVRTVLYNDSVALLAQTDQTYTLLEELERLRALALNYLGLELTVGVGLSCPALGELRQSTEGARSALDYRVLMGAAGCSISATSSRGPPQSCPWTRMTSGSWPPRSSLGRRSRWRSWYAV